MFRKVSFLPSFGGVMTCDFTINPHACGESWFVCFLQCGADVYIAISKEDGDTEETMGRKLCVLNRIITLLHGPVGHK